MYVLCIAQKRQSSARKQQLAATASSSSRLSNGHLVIETKKLPTNNDEQYSNIIPLELHHRSSSIQTNGIDSYSFADIEIASSVNGEQKHINPNATPKSIVSHNRSLATTNLSTCSTQSLLRKLRDKAQVLDGYYQDMSNKKANRPGSSLSSSSNSLLDQSGATPRLFLYRHRSHDSIRKSQRRKYRNFHDTISSDSSRFDLYNDEDNVLRELIRFNNDIDLILSRLEMEGENLSSPQTTTYILSEENHIEQSIDDNQTDDSIVDINPQINDQ